MQTTQQHSNHYVVSRLRKIASVVLMLAAIPLLASCGGGSEQGNGGGGNDGGGQGNGGGKAAEGQGEGTGGKKKQKPISDLRIIFSSPDKKSLNGKPARLKGMEVRSAVSERAFFVGENDAEQLLVLNIGDEVGVTEGQEVLVAGKLNVPNPNLEEKLSLSPEEVSAMEEQGIFLRAPRVDPKEG